MVNRRSIPRPPSSPAPERTPEKKEAAGISPGGGVSLPFASEYCSSRERRGRNEIETFLVLTQLHIFILPC